jgi:hypothetical protein
MTTASLYVLDVGQGQSTFIEITDDQGQLYNILIDLGTVSKRELADGSLNFLEAKLSAMPFPTIDVVLLTHSDWDHHDLVFNLLDRFYPFDPTNPGLPGRLRIKHAVYAGDRTEYGYHGKNTIDVIADYMRGEWLGPVGWPFEWSAFYWRKPHEVQPFLSIGTAVQCYCVCGNLVKSEFIPGYGQVSPNLPDGHLKNTVSLVLLFIVNGVGLLITGDATAHTMALCNYLITPEMKNRFFNNTLLVTAPHHGSWVSANLMTGLDLTAVENVREFVANVGAACIAISADASSTYNLPRLELLKEFRSQLKPPPRWSDPAIPGYHFFTTYIKTDVFEYWTPEYRRWPKYDGQYTTLTDANIYTTNYRGTVPKPWALPATDTGDATPVNVPKKVNFPVGVDWVFDIAANGASSVRRHLGEEVVDAALMERFAIPPVRISVPRTPVAVAGRRFVRVFP